MFKNVEAAQTVVDRPLEIGSIIKIGLKFCRLHQAEDQWSISIEYIVSEYRKKKKRQRLFIGWLVVFYEGGWIDFTGFGTVTRKR